MERKITANERIYLRELAAKVAEYANLPIMEERKRLWYAHNKCRGARPVVVMETDGFINEILMPLRCKDAAAQEIEWQLKYYIINHETIDDDKVVPAYFPVYWKIRHAALGLEVQAKHGTDSSGRTLGYQVKHPIKDLKADFHIFKPSKYSVDRRETMARKALAENAVGDILPVKLKNDSLTWFFAPTALAVNLMGMEQFFTAMLDCPKEFHRMMLFILEDKLSFLKWQEKEGLLTLNNENDYAGSGSYGFTEELPKSREFAETGKVTPKDLWGNMNSQESIGLSPSMYGEHIFPYYLKMAEWFGLVYYGCCEGVHDVWDDYVSKLSNLRKISVSPWCNEEKMGERLRGEKIIYSRKPSPNFVGVGKNLDEEAFTGHIRQTLQAAKGCHLEFICRDVYTLNGDASKPGRAVKIIRKLINEARA